MIIQKCKDLDECTTQLYSNFHMNLHQFSGFFKITQQVFFASVITVEIEQIFE